ALGDGPRAVVGRALREAQVANVPISFDVNYRSRLWTPAEARVYLVQIMPALRYLFIGADDAETVFGFTGAPEAVVDKLAELAPRAAVSLTLGEAGSLVRADGQACRPTR